jgi:hypothetical protein
MIGFIDTSLQLQLIITAHNQWLPKTLSIQKYICSCILLLIYLLQISSFIAPITYLWNEYNIIVLSILQAVICFPKWHTGRKNIIKYVDYIVTCEGFRDE